jgi:hypothetical protein
MVLPVEHNSQELTLSPGILEMQMHHCRLMSRMLQHGAPREKEAKTEVAAQAATYGAGRPPCILGECCARPDSMQNQQVT